MIINGLAGASIAIGLKIEGRDNEAKSYMTGAREVLDYLANPESTINKKLPFIQVEYGDTIEKAREKFPEESSVEYIEKLLRLFN